MVLTTMDYKVETLVIVELPQKHKSKLTNPNQPSSSKKHIFSHCMVTNKQDRSKT
jgi:hypothetical protein